MIKVPLIIASLILLFGCGFKPILTNKQLAYTISEIKYSGNENLILRKHSLKLNRIKHISQFLRSLK